MNIRRLLAVLTTTVVAIAVFSFTRVTQPSAQSFKQTSQQSVQPEVPDEIAYRHLFRYVGKLKKQADELEGNGKDATSYRTHFKRAANLSEAREPELCRALGLADSPVWLADGYNDAAIVEVADEAAVRAVKPEFAALKSIRRMAVVTARGKEQDVASRVFVPYLGIDEDPVTGSAHAALAPYWTKRLGRNEFTALQASSRTGMLHCRLEDGRAIIGGRCQTVIVGQFQL